MVKSFLFYTKWAVRWINCVIMIQFVCTASIIPFNPLRQDVPNLPVWSQATDQGYTVQN